MIQTFRVEIVFHHALNTAPCSRAPGVVHLDQDTVSNLSHFCDNLYGVLID
jgi:hypothetical protein